MSFSLNRLQLIGHLGQDATHKHISDNLCITSFSIATTHSYKKKDGEFSSETTWHGCVAYNLPDFYKEQLLKGKKFYVDGRLKKEEWTDKEGKQQKTTKVIVNQIIPCEGRSAGSYQQEEHAEGGGTVGRYEDAPANPGEDAPF